MKRWIKSLLKSCFMFTMKHTPGLRTVYESWETASPILLRMLFMQKVLGFNRHVPWPVHFTSKVSGWDYIKIGVEVSPGYMGGCYVFAKEDSPISIGDYTIVSANVCIAGYNHDIYDYTQFPSKGGVLIGRYCWLSMNSSVMPGVTLGDHTIVAAGAVVTESFPEGYCILGGVPARKIKTLDPALCVEKRTRIEFIGFKKVAR